MTDYPDIEDAKLMLGAAAIVLGKDHAATPALAQAVTTRKPADLEMSGRRVASVAQALGRFDQFLAALPGLGERRQRGLFQRAVNHLLRNPSNLDCRSGPAGPALQRGCQGKRGDL